MLTLGIKKSKLIWNSIVGESIKQAIDECYIKNQQQNIQIIYVLHLIYQQLCAEGLGCPCLNLSKSRKNETHIENCYYYCYMCCLYTPQKKTLYINIASFCWNFRASKQVFVQTKHPYILYQYFVSLMFSSYQEIVAVELLNYTLVFGQTRIKSKAIN